MTTRSPSTNRPSFLLVLLVLSLSFVVAASPSWADRGGESKPQSPNVITSLSTQDLDSGLTPTDVANTLVGEGVTISNVTYVGANPAAGTFTGGDGIIGFDEGIILSSGTIGDVVGPNTGDSTTTAHGTPGDADLTALVGLTTYDAAVLEFDFVTSGDNVFFDFVFSSEEYNEFVNTQYNDAFAFYINGTNCATVEGDPITINTINNGNPYNTDPRSNPHLYRNNDLDDGGGSIDTEMDGLTVVLTCAAAVNPGATNHIKLAIADASDESYDSAVFVKAGSLSTDPSTIALEPDSAQYCVGSDAMLTATVQSPEGDPLAGVDVTFEVTDGPHMGLSAVVTSDANGHAVFTYTGTSDGTDTIRASFIDALGNTIISPPSTVTWLPQPCDPTAVTLHSLEATGGAPLAVLALAVLLLVSASVVLIRHRAAMR